MCNEKPWKEGQVLVTLSKWKPEVNEIREQRSKTWLSMRGIPFHLWKEESVSVILKGKATIVELAPSSQNLSDLSALHVCVLGWTHQEDVILPVRLGDCNFLVRIERERGDAGMIEPEFHKVIVEIGEGSGVGGSPVELGKNGDVARKVAEGEWSKVISAVDESGCQEKLDKANQRVGVILDLNREVITTVDDGVLTRRKENFKFKVAAGTEEVVFEVDKEARYPKEIPLQTNGPCRKKRKSTWRINQPAKLKYLEQAWTPKLPRHVDNLGFAIERPISSMKNWATSNKSTNFQQSQVTDYDSVCEDFRKLQLLFGTVLEKLSGDGALLGMTNIIDNPEIVKLIEGVEKSREGHSKNLNSQLVLVHGDIADSVIAEDPEEELDKDSGQQSGKVEAIKSIPGGNNGESGSDSEDDDLGSDESEKEEEDVANVSVVGEESDSEEEEDDGLKEESEIDYGDEDEEDEEVRETLPSD